MFSGSRLIHSTQELEIKQKAYLFLDLNGNCGLTVSTFCNESKIFKITECIGIKKAIVNAKYLSDRLLENAVTPLQIYLFVDNLTYEQLTEALQRNEKSLDDDRIFTQIEFVDRKTYNEIEERTLQVKSYLNMNEKPYKCDNETLKREIILSIDKTPMPAKATSFLLAIEDLIIPSYQEIANIQGKAKIEIELPFNREIPLSQVIDSFKRYAN